MDGVDDVAQGAGLLLIVHSVHSPILYNRPALRTKEAA